MMKRPQRGSPVGAPEVLAILTSVPDRSSGLASGRVQLASSGAPMFVGRQKHRRDVRVVGCVGPSIYLGPVSG